ncbi:glycerophosphodiester phosphodiesterase 1 [Nothobranchius furzeri]|uniref:Glycerophosphodiester phosphodiesterase 1 n=2 Tax=Nothobranchius TaxID=28779 RepID=A0A8C6LUX1_NOTFU|nr:glycerophosphodiester phosphodiesterase 1 [Nothobranchius furzeri]KAF7223768.1 glycerophosphodiester phosphodiesterase 1 [Nothobranchius furzeri]
MLQLGDEVTLYSLVLVVVLLGTRSPVWSAVLTASLYFFLAMFRFPQVTTSRARQVLHPDSRAVGSGKVSVIAHRGGGHDAPENTIAAIREASKNGATGVELDLEFSADGVPILMHDETVDRTTNGSGRLSQIKFSELRKLDAAAKHRLRNKFEGEKIPTLQEAVEECIRLQLTIYFDVKGHPDQAAAALKDLYQKYPVLYNSSIVCSFEPKVIYRMRQSDPEVVTALTHRPWSLSRLGDGVPRFSSAWKHHWVTLMDIMLDWAHHHVLWRLCGVSAFLVQKNFVSQDYIQYWAQRGVELVVWTTNTKVEKAYYQELLHISYITDSLVEDCEPHY